MRRLMCLSLMCVAVQLSADEYAPLRVTKDVDVKSSDFTVNDEKRNRELPIRVYPLLPAGDKFELVLNKAEHSAFTERALPGE